MTDSALLWEEGRLGHCCMTGSEGHQTEPTGLHGDEHLRFCRAVMGACGIFGQPVRPGDVHLAGRHTACGVDQIVAEPVFADNPLCVCCMPSQPRAEPEVFCVGHGPSAHLRIPTESASLGDETPGTAPRPSTNLRPESLGDRAGRRCNAAGPVSLGTKNLCIPAAHGSKAPPRSARMGECIGLTLSQNH